MLACFFGTWWNGTNVDQAVSGMFFGFLAWLGFALPIVYGKKLWEGKAFKYPAIDAGYYLVSLLIAGAIIALMVNMQSGSTLDKKSVTDPQEMRQELPALNMTLPEGMVAISQNSTPTLSGVIAVPLSEFDKLQSRKDFYMNPSVAAIESDIPYIEIIKNTNVSVENLKDYLPDGINTPDGDFDIDIKEFVLRYSDADQKIDQYEYMYQIKSNPPVDRNGYIWQDKSNNIYEVKINDKVSDKTFGVTDTFLEDAAIRLLLTYTE